MPFSASWFKLNATQSGADSSNCERSFGQIFLEEIGCKYQASIGKVYAVDGVLKILRNICEACTSTLENMKDGSAESKHLYINPCKVFTVCKIMLEKKTRAGKTKNYTPQRFLAVAFRTLTANKAIERLVHPDCQTAVMSSINDMLISV